MDPNVTQLLDWCLDLLDCTVKHEQAIRNEETKFEIPSNKLAKKYRFDTIKILL